MKVGLLGSGEVAKTLASGFLKHGHDVTIGTRAPAKLAEWAKQNPKGRVGGFADTAKFGELGSGVVFRGEIPDRARNLLNFRRKYHSARSVTVSMAVSQGGAYPDDSRIMGLRPS
jgi:uncharacterized protein YbjT (DUF2867 family)